MSVLRLLIVEDSDEALEMCRNAITRYRHENQCEVKLIECKSVDEALLKLDNSFDGAIIDMKLAEKGDEGVEVIRQINESHFRIPVAILTGTPDVVDSEFKYIGVFKKGDVGAGYRDLFTLFFEIQNTGLTRIMGGKGIIEETLYKVFRSNLLPQKNKWVEYGKVDSSRTEKALLRHTLNHLLQLLDDDEDRNFPEEMYLAPPLTENIRTGSIVKQEQEHGDKSFAVMNPACDLVVRSGGSFKTDRILLVEIEKENDVLSLALDKISKADKKKKKRQDVFGNNHTGYYHWLPKTDFFDGGFLNFRKLSTITYEKFNEDFLKPEIQISPSFVKDVVARFSSYYARQGQPDIEHYGFVENTTTT